MQERLAAVCVCQGCVVMLCVFTSSERSSASVLGRPQRHTSVPVGTRQFTST
jgi:hypothetical protein